jgi:hypothetical protein
VERLVIARHVTAVAFHFEADSVVWMSFAFRNEGNSLVSQPCGQGGFVRCLENEETWRSHLVLGPPLQGARNPAIDSQWF